MSIIPDGLPFERLTTLSTMDKLDQLKLSLPEAYDIISDRFLPTATLLPGLTSDECANIVQIMANKRIRLTKFVVALITTILVGTATSDYVTTAVVKAFTLPSPVHLPFEPSDEFNTY